MSNFENNLRGDIAFDMGGGKTPEQHEAEKAARVAAAAEKAVFLEGRRREMAAEKAVVDKQNRERAEQKLEENAVAICLEANPNLSKVEATRLWNHSLRQLILARRFEEAFFAEKPKGFGDIHM
jgi:hypothetical protein